VSHKENKRNQKIFRNFKATSIFTQFDFTLIQFRKIPPT